MKHSPEITQQIIDLKNQGNKSRAIASLLSVSKSSVNYVFNRAVKANKSSTKRYLFLDIETSPDVAVTFRRFKANLSQDNILQDGGMLLSISWRWMGDSEAQGLALSPEEAVGRNDNRLCSVLYGLIESADAVIGHNISNFDIPMIKTRMIINEFDPLKKVKEIDTLKIARQMRFPSNRLGSLGVILGEGDKASHSGISTWIGCLAGNQASLDEMLLYNLEDVDLLYRVYMRLRPHDIRPLNAGLFNKKENTVCPCCGSKDVHETSNSVYTPLSEFKEYECGTCGSRSRSRTSVSTKNKRKSLLV